METGASSSSVALAGAFVLPWPFVPALEASLGFATAPFGDHRGCMSTAVHDNKPFSTYKRKVFSTKCGTGCCPMSFAGHFSGSHGHRNACVHP